VEALEMGGPIPDTAWVRLAREDLCEYTGLAPESVDRYFRRDRGYRLKNEFNAYGPRDEQELRWFYRSNRTYVMRTACLPYWEKIDRVLRPGMKVLDYGGGAGGIALDLARRGFDVSYLDIGVLNMDFVRFRARKHKVDIKVIDPFIEKDGKLVMDPIECVQGEYDLIILKDTLEHIPEYERTLRHLARRLAPGGIIMENTPFLRKKKRKFEWLRRLFWREGGLTLHLPEKTPIAVILADHGIEPVDTGIWRAPPAGGPAS
jgi:2-polyprenyl-3-methyl-5-hydroxy-6-metoxy-1,4-benzoquinol methylase